MSTDRMNQLTAMGFSVAESRIALEEAKGNVTRAAELLVARRAERERANGGVLVQRLNGILREQKTWNEFFERFMWPEHPRERVQTNLLYFRANYIIICGGITVISVLVRPSLLLVTGLIGGLFALALGWGDRQPVPLLNQTLNLDQRVAAAALVAAAMVNISGQVREICRIAMLCAGVTLSHATFRARSLAARWAFFRDAAEKQD